MDQILKRQQHDNTAIKPDDQAEPAPRESDGSLRAELAATRRLQELSTTLIQQGDVEALYRQLVSAATIVMSSDAASMQIFDPVRGELRLLRTAGLDAEAEAFWAWVRPVSGSTCGQALRSGGRLIVPDIETCEFMAGTADLDQYRRCEIRAVQSTPLISRSGRLLGMISTHWREPHEPPERDLQLFDVLARQAADLIERADSEEKLRESEERQAFLLKLSDALRPLADPVEIQGAAARLLGERLGSSRAYYFEYKSEEGYGTVARDYVRDGSPSVVGRYDYETYRTVLTRIGDGRTWIVPDLNADPALALDERELLTGHGVIAWIDVPLIKQEKLVAVLCVTQGSARQWTAAEVALVEETAERTWAAVERARAEAALRESEANLNLAIRAGNFGSWSMDLASGELNASPGCKEKFGRGAAEPFSYDDLRAAIHPEDRARQLQAIEEAIRIKASFTVEYRCVWPDGSVHWVATQGRYVEGEHGSGRLVGLSQEITDLKSAQRRQQLLIDELNHRVKNTLAAVQSIAGQTFRRMGDDDHAFDAFEGRLMALSKAHDLLTKERWEGAMLGDIVTEELAPYRGDSGARFAISGPEVRLRPKVALALGMAFHELATNAAKYGALSNGTGQVKIAWEFATAAKPAMLRLRWTETGGPPVEKPRRQGFGARLIERGLAQELNGDVQICYDRSGISCTFDVPVEIERDGVALWPLTPAKALATRYCGSS